MTRSERWIGRMLIIVVIVMFANWLLRPLGQGAKETFSNVAEQMSTEK
jgi:flagellar biogenesis protein FliO